MSFHVNKYYYIIIIIISSNVTELFILLNINQNIRTAPVLFIPKAGITNSLIMLPLALSKSVTYPLTPPHLKGNVIYGTIPEGGGLHVLLKSQGQLLIINEICARNRLSFDSLAREAEFASFEFRLLRGIFVSLR